MSDERMIPAEGEASVVTCTLLIDDAELPPTIEILGVVTEREANRVPRAKLFIRDGDVAAEDFPVSNEAHFTPGQGRRNQGWLRFAGNDDLQGLDRQARVARPQPEVMLDCRVF